MWPSGSLGLFVFCITVCTLQLWLHFFLFIAALTWSGMCQEAFRQLVLFTAQQNPHNSPLFLYNSRVCWSWRGRSAGPAAVTELESLLCQRWLWSSSRHPWAEQPCLCCSSGLCLPGEKVNFSPDLSTTRKFLIFLCSVAYSELWSIFFFPFPWTVFNVWCHRFWVDIEPFSMLKFRHIKLWNKIKLFLFYFYIYHFIIIYY